MAGSYNKVILLGNLTRDLELRYTPNNTAVANFGLAVNRTWRSPDGQQQEETTFVDCEAWGKQAEIMGQYLGKGRKVFLEGRLKLDQWKDKTDGSNRSKLKVVVEEFRFVDSKPGGGSGSGADGGEGGAAQGRPSGSRGQGPGQSGGGGGGGNGNMRGGGQPAGQPAYEQIQEDDIPF
ncbi:MAG TPA: single-stranded DNA-binding protein [Phycisphaerales bacterium]|nr:single-stranded DNA-binding protein [Phycisphaerales bacterium]